MLKMNRDKLYTIWIYITLPFHKLYYLFWVTIRAVKYGFQRMFRKYSGEDSYSFYWNFVDRHYKLLKHFKKKTINHPYKMTEELWDEILDEMIHHLEMMDEDKVAEHLQQGMPEGWRPIPKTVSDIMERHKDEFFDLMKKHFYDMWY